MPGNHRSLPFSTSNLMHLVSRQKAFVMSLSVIEGSVLDSIFEVTFLSVCPKVGRAISITFAVVVTDIEAFRNGPGEGFVHQMMDKELPLLSVLIETYASMPRLFVRDEHKAHGLGVQNTSMAADAVVRVPNDGAPFFIVFGLIPREIRDVAAPFATTTSGGSITCVALMCAQLEVSGMIVGRVVIFMTDEHAFGDWTGEGFVHEAVDVESTLDSVLAQIHTEVSAYFNANLKLIPTFAVTDTTRITDLVPRKVNDRFPGFSFHNEDQSTTWALAA